MLNCVCRCRFFLWGSRFFCICASFRGSIFGAGIRPRSQAQGLRRGVGRRSRFWDRNSAPKTGPDSGPFNQLWLGLPRKRSRNPGRIPVPKTRPEIGPSKLNRGVENKVENGTENRAVEMCHQLDPFQASAVWQWWNHACSWALEGQAVLRVNMDETSVCLCQGDAKGTVVATKKRLRDQGAPGPDGPLQQVSRSRRRTCLTHVAFVCDQTWLQPRLPQVIIGNCHTFLAGEWQALLDGCPDNVYLVRQRSAWNDAELLARIVHLLGAVLRPYASFFHPVLLLDACRLHISDVVLRACNQEGIYLVVVPAKLTWLLQPLDTHCFRRYKVHLKEAYQRARAATPEGQLRISEFLAALYDTIRVVMQGERWAVAFDSDGFCQGQSLLSMCVQRQLQYERPPVLPCALPSAQQLQLCFPKNARVSMPLLLRPFQLPVQPKARAAKAGLPAPPLAMAALQAPPVARGAPLVPRRGGGSASSSAGPARFPLPPASAAASGSGPMTRAASSRLTAALAKGPGGRPAIPLLGCRALKARGAG